MLDQEREHLRDLRQAEHAVAELAPRAHQLEQPVAGDVAQVVDLEVAPNQRFDQLGVDQAGIEQRFTERATAREVGSVAIG